MNFLLDDPVVRPAEPLRLPSAPHAARPSPFPFVAAVAPLAAAGAMWAVTGSLMMLWFAALTPVMLLGTLWDRRRARRRDRRAYDAELTQAISAAREQITRRHDEERATRSRVHPDLLSLCGDPANVWRTHPGRENTVAVGSGLLAVPAAIDDSGDDPRVAELRALSTRLEHAPIVIPWEGVICVRGPAVVRAAVVRALVLQLCVVHPVAAWHITGGDEGWMRALPHARSGAARRTLSVISSGQEATGDVALVSLPAGGVLPAGATAMIDVADGLRATMTRGAAVCSLTVEAVSVHQATALAEALARRAASLAPAAEETVGIAMTSAGRRGTLGVTVGRASDADVWLDIVTDGPHAVVIGTTGAGKSEFLVTWAYALCRAYSPDEVTLILADFKGGTAFEPLATLPHVVGVITDLDGARAERAVRSLAAEVRRREAKLADVGARDVADARVSIPRLVVMVDEFPALLSQHPHLEPIFTDISARGRALGIHLVLGGQRVAGVVRDATLANCGLRIALRVSDPHDSRTVIGTDDAARLPGTPEARGSAYVRRCGDTLPQRLRIAMTTDDDIAAVTRRGDAPSTEPPPWLPPLPTLLPIERLRAAGADIIGLADDPDASAQPPVRAGVAARGLAVIGGPASGKSATARLVAEVTPGAALMSADAEVAWSQLMAWEAESPAMIICDDVDVLLTRYPEPWAAEFTSRLDALIARAGVTGTAVVLTAGRSTGAINRLLGALPQRAILALPTRADHVAAGGQPQDHVVGRPAGRGILEHREVQFGWVVPRPATADGAAVPARWSPAGDVVGWVTRSAAPRLARIAHHWGYHLADVSTLPAGVDVGSLGGTVLVGDPEAWQRAWHLGDLVRRTGQFLVGSECAPDYRAITGDRALPPFALPGRAWVVRPGMSPERVVLE